MTVEINEEFEKMSDAINDIARPILEEVSNETYISIVGPIVFATIHQLILEGKLKLC